MSQKKRKRIEEIFGWLKTTGPAADKVPRPHQVTMAFTFAPATYNLIRMPKLMGKTA